MYADHHLQPWLECLLRDLDGISLLDAHTHVGINDIDGFRCTPAELLDSISLTGSRAVVFPMQEPIGYSEANDDVLAEAEASNGRLIAFCRLDPAVDPLREAKRCVQAGARGIKLHPRAENFRLDDSRLDEVFAFADAHRLPVLIHAGRGIPALGRHALQRCATFPNARIVLAHAGISDLSWIWRFAKDHSNLYFDTAWWSAADLLMLFAFVPPGQILFGSDVPYATSVQGVIATVRCALQVGLSFEQVTVVAGGQLERLLSGDDPLDIGPPAGTRRLRSDPFLTRVHSYLMLALGQIGAGGKSERALSLARLACDVGDDAPQAGVCDSVISLLDRHEAHLEERRRSDWAENYSNLHLIGTATVVALTPDVSLPPMD